MSQSETPDLNAIVRQTSQQVLSENVAGITASVLLTIAGSLRAQGHAALGEIQGSQLVTPPALLEGDRALALVPFIRGNIEQFRLIVAHSSTGERVYTAFLENEMNTLQSRYLELTEEFKAELDRQMDVIKMERKGYAEFGLLIVPNKVEGYEYFVPEQTQEKTE